MPAFLLHIGDVDEQGLDHTFDLPNEWLEETLKPADMRPDQDAPKGTLSVHAQKNGKELLLTGRIQAHVVGRCVRCLEDARMHVQVPWAMLLKQDKTGGKPARGPAPIQVSNEDLDRGTYASDTLLLDPLVAEQLLVECPMQPLCRDDCKGLEVPAHIRPPADFGAKAEGVDPRLSPLLKLKDTVPPKKE